MAAITVWVDRADNCRFVSEKAMLLFTTVEKDVFLLWIKWLVDIGGKRLSHLLCCDTGLSSALCGSEVAGHYLRVITLRFFKRSSREQRNLQSKQDGYVTI